MEGRVQSVGRRPAAIARAAWGSGDVPLLLASAKTRLNNSIIFPLKLCLDDAANCSDCCRMNSSHRKFMCSFDSVVAKSYSSLGPCGYCIQVAISWFDRVRTVTRKKADWALISMRPPLIGAADTDVQAHPECKVGRKEVARLGSSGPRFSLSPAAGLMLQREGYETTHMFLSA